MGNELQLQHCADYDRYGVRITQPEMLKALAGNGTVTIGIGADPLTRKTYTMTAGEASRLADWINDRLRGEADSEHR